jgi:hypothetical protein
MKIFLTVLVLGLIGQSCSRGQGTVREIPFTDGVGMVNSINGEVMYRFDPETYNVEMVFNFKQKKNGYYLIQINNDTLEIGEEFQGRIFFQRHGICELIKPYDTLVDTKISKSEFFGVKWPTNEIGESEMSGTLRFDDEQFPFEYKFIVVDKGTRKNKFEFTRKIQGGNDPNLRN